jgi:hypothetical protein
MWLVSTCNMLNTNLTLELTLGVVTPLSKVIHTTYIFTHKEGYMIVETNNPQYTQIWSGWKFFEGSDQCFSFLLM